MIRSKLGPDRTKHKDAAVLPLVKVTHITVEDECSESEEEGHRHKRTRDDESYEEDAEEARREEEESTWKAGSLRIFTGLRKALGITSATEDIEDAEEMFGLAKIAAKRKHSTHGFPEVARRKKKRAKYRSIAASLEDPQKFGGRVSVDDDINSV
jgi:hypothetical protein